MMNGSAYFESLNKRPAGWTFTPRLEASNPSYSFEQIDPFYWLALVEQSWTLKYYASALYLVTIFGLKWYMKDRPAFELQFPLFLWNASIGVFSSVAVVRCLPDIILYFREIGGFVDSICSRDHTSVPILFWALMFAISKFVELGDTVFIILRKRPLVLLQWYHHLATLWVVWSVAPYVEPITRWYGGLNYIVHSIMYPYFALRAIGIKIPKFIANIITTLQLTQMLAGFGINMYSLYLRSTGYDCYRHPESIRAFNIVYGTFIVLFGKLFYDSVLKNKRRIDQARRDNESKKIS